MHLFTVIQIFWLSLLWGVKYTPIALSFPFILIILVPFRFFVLKFVFSPDELSAVRSWVALNSPKILSNWFIMGFGYVRK